MPPPVGLGSPGVGLRASGSSGAEAFAVGVGAGALTGACSTGTAAATTVSSAAAAQMILPYRRKLATIRRGSVVMKRTNTGSAVVGEDGLP